MIIQIRLEKHNYDIRYEKQIDEIVKEDIPYVVKNILELKVDLQRNEEAIGDGAQDHQDVPFFLKAIFVGEYVLVFDGESRPELFAASFAAAGARSVAL
jgi:hypothetical protein